MSRASQPMPVSARSGALIGRQEDLSRAILLLAPGRVLTLWGPGGIGKTSLAREVYAGASFGEMQWVSLASSRTRGDLLARLCEALEMQISTRTDDEALLLVRRAIGLRARLLLVLDNVEQIASEMASVLGEIGPAARGTCFVLTSREVLGIPGEVPLELSPLSVHGKDQLPSDAAALLLARAKALRPSFQAEPALLDQIAARLDGLPLALELAAARLSTMSPSELLTRLDDRFSVLRRTHARAEPRQRTLYDAIEWSWTLLPAAEQDALAKASVFRAGFSAEAAHAVLGDDADELLLALRHKSLLLMGNDSRFDLYESIRDFAAQKLGPRRAATELQHARWYVQYACSTDADLQAETENLLAICERAFDAGDPAHRHQMNDLAIGAIAALGPVLVGAGEAKKLAMHAERVCGAMEQGAAGVEPRVAALATWGSALFALGQLADAAERMNQALLLGPGKIERARLLRSLGDVHQALGELEEARRLAESALAHAQASGAHQVTAQATASLAVVFHSMGELETARVFYTRALLLLEATGPLLLEVRTRARLGFLLQDLGDHAAARREYQVGLLRLGEARAPAMRGILVGYLGNAQRAAREYAAAAESYACAVDLQRVAGDRRFEATFLMDRAICHLLQEDAALARADLELAMELSSDIGDPTLRALLAGYLVVARAGTGDLDGARITLASARTDSRSATSASRELLDVAALHMAIAIGDLAPARAMLAGGLAGRPGQHQQIAVELLAAALFRRAPPADAFVLRGACLTLPEGAQLDLQGRPNALRVVWLLARRRLSTPGEWVPSAELVAHGWPGERIADAAAKNRLRVLISHLRTAGLGRALESDTGGYRLSPAVPVLVAEMPQLMG